MREIKELNNKISYQEKSIQIYKMKIKIIKMKYQKNQIVEKLKRYLRKFNFKSKRIRK